MHGVLNLNAFRRRFKRRRSAFGIDAAIMIGFFLAIMGVLAFAGPQILVFFADQLMGGANGAYQLLIELPIIPDNPSTQPTGGTPAQWVGWAAARLYPLLQSMGLALFAIVLVIASLCYLLETFRVMGEGTAMNIITNSVFALILIFGVKYIYNGVAAAMNVLTGWPSVGGTGLIIQSGAEINALMEALGGAVLTENWELVVRAFGSIVLFIIAVSTLVLTVMMGAVRLLLVGCLAAALPLLLMLRLIPPVRHLADSLIETVIGIVFASLIAAILIHFGYSLVAMTGLGGFTKLVAALATFLGAAYMSTMFAGRLGSLFSSVAGMSTMATSMATGLMLGGATTVAGGVAGAVSSWTAGGGKGAILKGFAGGAGMAAAQVLPAIATGKSPGKALSTAMGAMPMAAQTGKNLAMNNAGTSLESLINSFAAAPYPGESGSEGLEWYQRSIEGKSDEMVGHYFADRTGLTLDHTKAGDEIKKTLADLKGQPVLLDRIHKNLRDFAKQDEDERHRGIAAAVKAKDANRRRVEAFLGRQFYDPFLEGLDKSPSFVDKILMDVGPAGVQTKARALELMHKDYDESKLSAKAGEEFYNHITKSKTAEDSEIGVWVRDNLGIYVPDETLEHLGHEFEDTIDDVVVRNPLLLDNFRRNLEAVKSSGGFKPGEHGIKAIPELDRLGENTSWWGKMRERHLTTKRVDLGSDISDFWNLAGSGGGGSGGGGGSPPASPQQTPQQPQPTPPPETPPKGKMEAFMEAQQKKGRRNLLEVQKDCIEYMGESMETGSTNKSE